MAVEGHHELHTSAASASTYQLNRLPELISRRLSLPQPEQHKREHHGNLLPPAGQEAGQRESRVEETLRNLSGRRCKSYFSRVFESLLVSSGLPPERAYAACYGDASASHTTGSTARL